MTTKIEELKVKRDQLNARIQKAEARAKATEKKADDRVKVLVGAAILNAIKSGQAVSVQGREDLVQMMQEFLTRTSERDAVLGEDGNGSDALRRLT